MSQFLKDMKYGFTIFFIYVAIYSIIIGAVGLAFCYPKIFAPALILVFIYGLGRYGRLK